MRTATYLLAPRLQWRHTSRVVTAARNASSLVGSSSSSSSSRRSTDRASTPSSTQARVYKNPFLSSSHYRDADPSTDVTEPIAPEPLLALGTTYKLFPNDVHCFLGLNGSGKSRFLAQLQQLAASQTDEQRSRPRIASLSLDAHRAFVAQYGNEIVANVLGGVGSLAARDVIVRLGLYPVYESHVRHLSTGEMRKLLLAQALLATPRADVLALDQPFDGLDVAARDQLTWMLTQLTRGFTQLLVNTGGRSDPLAYRTQVLLVANRLEHVVPEILSHVALLRTTHNQIESEESEESDPVDSSSHCRKVELVACPKSIHEGDRKAQDALLTQLRAFYDAEHRMRPVVAQQELQTLIQTLVACRKRDAIDRQTPAIALQHVTIAYEQRVLLNAVDFVRLRHEHWALVGPNGSGKSSLMRVLLQVPGHGLVDGDVVLYGVDRVRTGSAQSATHTTQQHSCIAAVSTDQHIRLLQDSTDDSSSSNCSSSAFDLIVASAASSTAAAIAVTLLQLDAAMLRTRSFAELSQGEQKLVLLAKALATCPDVLLLDEISHGLDPFNRAHVLRMIDTLGAVQATHLVLITHHDDEIVDCFADRVFEIKDKQLVQRTVKSS